MRLGYAFHGFMGDIKLDAGGSPVSTPDGNATYSWSIISEAQRRGHSVYLMQQDRDAVAWLRHGPDIFSSFSKERRTHAYLYVNKTVPDFFPLCEKLPDLDVLLIEWRWPIIGRNCEQMGDGSLFCPNHLQRDLARQTELLDHYESKGTPIIIWDLDHKLTPQDELEWLPAAIFETSTLPRELTMRRVRVEPPILTSELLQHPTLPSSASKKLVYIGSRYERDDVIDKWIKPVSDKFPGQIEFHGKWDDDARIRWPNVKMEKRCTVQDFRRIYGDASACPILAKSSYMDTGFMTPRPWEALLFGTLPVGFRGHLGIQFYVPPTFLAEDPDDLIDLVRDVSSMNVIERNRLREELAHDLSFMDAKYFVNKVEDVANGNTSTGGLVE